jgi:mono/diheme cytochrome c family protein
VKTTLKIFAFSVVVIAFYSYVGQMVPQKVTYPPEDIEISADLTTDEMVALGSEIVSGKGTCLGCHTIGSTASASSLRFPDLANVGARAGSRVEGESDVEYLAHSLYDPNSYVVEGFLAGMPPTNRPPISLNDNEILTVIAYLQSLGGTPTVTMQTVVPGAGQTPAPATSPAPAVGATEAAPPMDGPTLYSTYLCGTCHSLDSPTPLVGPSLFDVGRRLSKAQIYESIMEPDLTVAEGFSAGVMGATLGAVGFYDKITTAELKVLVDFLASHQGG